MTKVKILLDPKNLKMKHLSGICFQLDNSPQPDDILFTFMKRKRKNMDAAEIAAAFSSENAKNNTEISLQFLVDNGYLVKEEDKYQLVA